MVYIYKTIKIKSKRTNPITPEIGYNNATKLENPSLARGIDNKQNKVIIRFLYLLSDTLFIKLKPLANAVVNMATHNIIE